jgi:integrase
MSFDARAAKLLTPGKHITCPEHPGLRLEAFEGKRTWTYRFRSPVDGRLRQMKIGQWPKMSIHAAIAAWENLRAQRDAGQDPAAEGKAAREKKKDEARQARERVVLKQYTVADVCNDYWKGHVRVLRARKGATEVSRMFDTMLGEAGKVSASVLGRAQAFDLIQRYAETAPVQAKKLRAELGAAWDYAIDAGRLSETTPNWWRLVMRGRIKSQGKQIAGQKIGEIKRALSQDEVGTLIRWLPNFTALVEDVLTVYLWTCTRGAEIVGMGGNEVAREGDGIWWWTIPKARTKNARHANAADMRVPLYGRALDVVLRRKERFGDGFLFAARGRDGKVRPIEQKTIQSAVWMHQPYSTTRPDMQRVRLSVTHWSPHDLRRTSRTVLAALGCPDAVGEALLGHMQPGVVGTYNRHSYDAERAAWLGRLSERLEELAVARL